MEHILRIILPTYFIIYFAFAFIAKNIAVAKRIGKNPIALQKNDNIYGHTELYFGLVIIFIFIYVLLFAFVPTLYSYFLPITYIDTWTMKYIGLGILAFTLVWTIIAQEHLKNSWRIGIDTKTKTEFITTGIFARSRNPIFLGIIGSLIGLFLITPNALTTLFLILGYILIQIQIKLEEEFLMSQHGQKYMDYKQKVRQLL
ncbi:MAG TPA: isoprenylcysteine carboxylmethyltransferase family protein [Flavobacterium sp.]|jgi:protein-S-isoprenylcysteine O-methyltransferase Ste14